MEARTGYQPDSKVKRGLILLAEILLVLVIVSLLVAIWLPAWVGPHPGVSGR